MNCSFRLVWSVAKGLWVVASELVRGKTKSRSIKLMTSSPKTGLSCLAISGLIAHSSMSFAADFYTWTGTESSADGWNLEVSNWDKGSVPSSSDDVSLNGTVSATGNAISMDRLYMATTSLAKLTISNGAANSIAQDAYVGNVASQNGFLYLKNSGTSLTVGNLNVGRYGIGTVEISDGATLSVSGSLIIALKANSTGTLNIGSAAGESASAAGFLSNATSITFDPTGSASASTLVLNHTNTDYQLSQNLVDSTGNSNIYLYAGTTSFTGTTNGYKGSMNVDGGTLSIAAGKTLTLGGNYHQTSGTLKVGATSATDFGKLKVNGTATFAKDAKIDVDVTKSDAQMGGTISGVVEADSLTASTFQVSDNSGLLDFTAKVNGNNIDLVVVQGTNDKGVKVSLTRTAENAGFRTGVGAAKVLDKFVQGDSSGTAEMDVVVKKLTSLPTDQLNDAVAQTLPLLSGSSTNVSAGVMQSNSNVVATRQSGASSGDGFISDEHAWVKPVGSWAKQGSRNGVSGYDAKTYGIIGGMDDDINDTTSVGFALSYMNTKADGKGTNTTNHADIDAYQVMLYGQRNLGESFHNLDVTWQAGLGVNQTNGTRNINFMGTKAKSDYTSYTGNLSAGLGRTFTINSDTLLAPSVRASYSYIKDESYKETGADALNLNVDSNKADSFILSVQGDLSQRLSDSLTLDSNVSVGYDVINDAASLTASYSGGGAAFKTEGLELSPWVMTAGLGVNYALDDATEITVSYDLEGRSDFLSQTATAKFKWMF